jgi:hypothetical protein
LRSRAEARRWRVRCNEAPALAADLLHATRRENTMLIGVMHLLFAWATVAAALGVIARMR